jgi:hypothetical protein
MEKRSSDMEGSCEYTSIEKTIAESLKGVVQLCGVAQGATTPNRKNLRCYETFHKASKLDLFSMNEASKVKALATEPTGNLTFYK